VDRRPTRRDLVARGLRTAAGAAAGAGLVLGAGAEPALADTAVPSDGEALSKVLQVERLMVLAYRRVLASGALGAGDNEVVSTQLGHELEHASTLAAHLQALGTPAVATALDLRTGQALLAKHPISGSLTDLNTPADCLRLLVDLESIAEGAYFTALKTLGSAELIRLSAEAMACEAQHWTVLSGLRNPGIYVKSVPWPFVTGSS
jgi:Ferritin-like domain